METNQNNDLHGNNTAKDLSQAQDSLSNNNKPASSSETTSKQNEDTELNTTQASSTTDKEHDDTDHDHEYKDPIAEQRKQQTNDESSRSQEGISNEEQREAGNSGTQ